MYNKIRIPFSLDDLPAGESIALHDVDGFIPYLTEKWPEGGRPDRVEMSGPRDPKGVDGYVGMFTSVTGHESQEYMDDAANHELWTRSSLVGRFPWVREFLTSAAPNDVARFDDTTGAYTLERD